MTTLFDLVETDGLQRSRNCSLNISVVRNRKAIDIVSQGLSPNSAPAHRDEFGRPTMCRTCPREGFDIILSNFELLTRIGPCSSSKESFGSRLQWVSDVRGPMGESPANNGVRPPTSPRAPMEVNT